MSDFAATDPRDKVPASEPLFTAEEPPKPGRGCFFYGCVSASIIGVLGLLLICVLSYVAYNFLDKTIVAYTSTTPAPLPKTDYTEDQRKDFETRRQAYQSAVDKGEAAEIVLTADDINVWIDSNPDLKGLIYIKIVDDKINGQLSLPLEKIPFLMGLGKGRFFNGTATITVSLHDSELVVHATEVQANGKTPTAEFMKQLSRENLAKDVSKNPEYSEMISHLDKIEVKDGKVYVTTRARSRDATTGIGDEPKTDEKSTDEPKVDAKKPVEKTPETRKPDEPKADDKTPDEPRPVEPSSEKSAA